MNVLLLTPDAVGGTLLHTVLTIYMQFHRYDQPVISLYDLSLGLEKYWHPDFNREIARTHEQYQTLDQIQQVISSVDHYKVAKLTEYNIKRRKDPIAQQVPFYKYLNDNFFVIACRRDNMFEHSLSWALNKITNRLNVYSFDEKVSAFARLYSDGVTIDPISLTRSLEDYKSFVQWCDDNFSVASYYRYEHNVYRLEEYVLDLPIFNGQSKRNTWKDVYGIDFNNWNRYHYLSNDIGSVAMQDHQTFAKLTNNIGSTNTGMIDYDCADQEALKLFVMDYNAVADRRWPKVTSIEDYENLPDHIKHECEHVHRITYHLDTVRLNSNAKQFTYSSLSSVGTVNNFDYNKKLQSAVIHRSQEFLQHNHVQYLAAADSIERMRELGILGKTIPVKKQTLAEKSFMIKNFSQCVDVYNTWITNNSNLGTPISEELIQQQSAAESEIWHGTRIGLSS